MSFELKLAYKYFRARRKSLARFTSFVAIVGIAAGVASLIIAQALAKGFADEMRDKILANTAHISIFSKDGGAISNWQEIAENIKSIENISEIEPTAYDNAIIIGETETSYAVLKVSSPKSQISSQSSKQLETWDLGLETVAVGVKLAEKLNLKSGSRAEIVTLENQMPTRLIVSNTFETGLYDYDSTWIYVSSERYAQLHGQRSFTPTILSLSVKNIYASGETAQKIRALLGENFKVVDWQEANRPLFAALSLERKVALAVIALIIFIAALNITTTLSLLVNERKLDIAILRTCGASARSLITVFLIEGLFLGLTGIFAGIVLGLLGCFLANRFKIISIPAEVYSLNYIPLRPEISSVVMIAGIAFLLCLTACVFPALKASRIKPLENLRTQ